MRMKLTGCFLTVAATLFAAFAEDAPPVVDIKAGRLIGKTLEAENFPRPLYAFLGVPYAQPPVGDLRFSLAQPVTPWEGTRDAREFAAGCPQNETMVKHVMKPYPMRETALSEDCLYLDVYTPDVNGKRDVLFLIHGGGFTVGKSSIIDGSAVAAFGDIVVVSIAYRIGILGFLQNNNGDWPQNLGFRDQQFALRWARDNVAAFGGDPERITIGGESAGSISTSLHVVSPDSRGLFHRAICQSGSLYSMSWTTEVDYGALALYKLNCSDLDAESTLDCLRSKSIEDIVDADVPGAVIADGDVYPKDPIDAYPKLDFPNVDMLIGVTEDEGYLFAEWIVQAISADDIDLDSYKQQLTAYLQSRHGNNAEEMFEEIVKHYFGGDMTGHTTDFIRQQTADILGTDLLAAPTYLNAQLHADRGATTFFYNFVYRPSFLDDLRPSWHSGGCDHGFDLTFTLGLPLMMDLLPSSLNVTDEDIEMTKIALNYWINFIKTGNPNGQGLVEWKPFTRDEAYYMLLQPNCQQASGYKADDMVFWNEKIRAMDVPPEEPRDEL